MKNRIEWEAWVNPYTNDANKEFVGEEEGEKIFSGLKYHDNYEFTKNDRDETLKSVRPGIPSPLGIVPVSIYHNFAEYQLWKGSTNFIIDEDEVYHILNTTPGVERLTVYTPYTFIVGFGKLFDSAQVKADIQRRLRANPIPKGESNPLELSVPKELKRKIDALKSQMNTKHWAILVLPNESVEICMSDDISTYESELNTFQDIQEVTGAIIFTNPA